MHKFLFYNKFIIFLYMFRALCAHHQEIRIVLYSIFLKSLMPLYKSLMFLILLLFSYSSISSFRYALFLFLKCLLVLLLTFFKLSTLLWLRSCIHRILVCFLSYKKPKHSSSNHDLCCFSSCRPRLSLAEVLFFSLMFSQDLFMSLSSLKVLQSCKPVFNLSLIFPSLQHIWLPEIKSFPNQSFVLLVYVLPIFP